MTDIASDARKALEGVERQRRRAIASHHDQMLDAMAQCVPCRLCGGKAIIGDAGPGHGYYIECSGAERFRNPTCLQGGTRISGWAYNVSDLWNKLNAAPALADRVEALEAALEAISTHTEGKHGTLTAAAIIARAVLSGECT